MSSAAVDVAWRGEVVAGNEPGLELARPSVRDARPGRPGEEHRMQPDTVVGRRDDLVALVAPGLDDPVDCARVEVLQDEWKEA